MSIYKLSTRSPGYVNPVKLALFGALLPIAGYSQTNNQSEGSDDVFTLSPFQINGESDIGYRATSTLAGTRIKTDLKDLASAITVVTEEFLQDTGATNLAELLAYTTSTEIGGMQGNYSGSDQINGGNGKYDQDGARADSQSSARVRGLNKPIFTRNFFTTSIPLDAYNTGSITMNRGPNSLLFGLGSAGGVVDNGLKMARVGGKDRTDITIRTDNNKSERYSFGISRNLIDGRLAIRVDGLYDDKRYRQDEAFEAKQRISGSIEAILFKSKGESFLGNTTLRIHGEAGEEDMTPPDGLPPLLAWDPFFSPPVDFRPYNGKDYPQTYDWLASNWSKWQTVDARMIPNPAIANFDPNNFAHYLPGWYENNLNHPLNAPVLSTPHVFNQMAVVYPGDNFAPGYSSTVNGFYGWVQPVGGNAQALNPWLNTRAYEDGGWSTGFKSPSLTDTNVFDFKNHLITGGVQEIGKRYDSQIASVEQLLFGGKVGLEATVSKEYYHIDKNQPFGGNNRDLPIYIDTSEYLFNGTENPNVGRAFLLARTHNETERTENRANKRGTIFAEHDFAENFDGLLGRIIGKHRVTGLVQDEEYRISGLNYVYNWDATGGLNLRGITSNAPTNASLTNDPVVQVAYISGDLRGVNEEDVVLNRLNFTPLVEGDTHRMPFYDKISKTYGVGNFEVRRVANGGQMNGSDVRSKAVAWQSYFLDQHIVGLAGWRTDEIETYERIGNTFRSATNEYLPTNLAFRPETQIAEGDTFTWSVVGHLPQNWVDKIPGASSVSAHYGESENFEAIEVRNDIYNRPIDNPSGITTEYGVTLGFAEDKWLLKINHFETFIANKSVLTNETRQGPGTIKLYLDRWQDGAKTNVDFTTTTAYKQGFKSYDEVFNAILSAIPEPLKGIYDYNVNPISLNWESEDTINNLNSTSDVKSTGYEVELVGNPTSNWRISLNGSQIKAINANTAAPLFQFYNELLAGLERTGLDKVTEGTASIVLMPTRLDGSLGSALLGARAKDGTVSQELREYRLNFVNTYSFSEGRFKGASVGGALRWQSEVGTGYGSLLNEQDQPIPDLNKVFKGPAELNGDVWVSYKKKLQSGIDWRIQLNLRNVVGDQDLIPTYTNPDGQDVLFRIAPAREWMLTNSFSF